VWKAFSTHLGEIRTQALAICAIDPGAEGDLYPVTEAPAVLPDPGRTKKRTWRQVKAQVPHPESDEGPVGLESANSIVHMTTKEEREDRFEEVFPFRSKADRRLRRTRFEDWYYHASRTKTMGILVDTIASLGKGSDYIYCINVICARYILGEVWWQRMSELDAFGGSLDDFINCAKWLNTCVKVEEIDVPESETLAELSVLTGIRNLPFPGFDVMQEAEALAQGGLEFNLYGRTFRDYFKEFVSLVPDRVESMSLREYIESGVWQTAGSSSMGKYQIEIRGEIFKVKCNKHTVTDVLSIDEIYEACRNLGRQTNYAVTKPETGKVRMVVAGDLATYIVGAYLTYCTGRAKYKIEGLTRGESFRQKLDRLTRMTNLCKTHYTLAFDYKAFDHQPTTEQIKDICDIYFECGVVNVSDRDVEEWADLKRRFIAGFDNAILLARDGDERREFEITGGLMSGLPVTSDVGDFWNYTMTKICLLTLQRLGVQTVDVVNFINGDDSAIYVPNWATGALMNAAYAVTGVEGGVGKFALQGRRPGESGANGRGGKMEFLRQWFTADKVSGWPARALRGITSDLPTADSGWSTTRVIRAIYESIKTLRRRLPSRHEAIDSVWDSLKRVWCRNHNLPVAFTMLPLHAGGLGLDPLPTGLTLMSDSRPLREPDIDVTFIGTNERRADLISSYALKEYGLSLARGEAIKLGLSELKSTVLADSVRSASSEARRVWLDEVRNARPKVRSYYQLVDRFKDEMTLSALTPENYRSFMKLLRSRMSLFNSCPRLAVLVRDYKRLGVKGGLLNFIRQYDPRSWSRLRMFNPTWHLAARIDYLTGSIPMQTRCVHPDLLETLKLFVAYKHRPKNRYTKNCQIWLATRYEQELLLSHLSQKLFMC